MLMNFAKEKLEMLIGLELIVTLDTREEVGCEDEEFGHYLQCGLNMENPIPDYEPPMIVLYENELVQFFHDASPYPVAAHTAQEAREMLMFLNPAPVHIDQITEDDFKNFISSLVDEYGEE
jgi:hypothetical protein